MNTIVFPLLLVFLIGFMFLQSRRQKKAVQATIDLHESLTIGDRVHTTSGLEATIAGLTEDTVDLEIAPGVITTWMKLAIRDKIEPDTDEDDDYDDDDDEDSTLANSSAPATTSATELTESETSGDADRLTKD